jgi:hypothetical protein
MPQRIRGLAYGLRAAETPPAGSGLMLAPQLAELSPGQLDELDGLYRTTKSPRLRTRAQMILLAAEHGLVAGGIAVLVRSDEGRYAVGSSATKPKASTDWRTYNARARRRGSRRRTVSDSLRSSATVLARLGYPSRFRRCSAWRTSWPRRRGCASRMRRYAAPCGRRGSS